MKIYPRKRWGGTGFRGSFDMDKRTMVVHHSAGQGMAIDTFAEQCAVVRAIERQHRGQGWDAIGYNFVIFQPYGRLRRARVFEGRGWDRLPAAQKGRNTGTLAVCVVGNLNNERPRLSTLWRLVGIGRRAYKRGVRHLRGHRDFGGTQCPGDNLYPKLGWIRKRTNLA